jgi:hypothetical protein
MSDYFTDTLKQEIEKINMGGCAISRNGTHINSINYNFEDESDESQNTFIASLNDFFKNIPQEKWEQSAEFIAWEMFSLAHGEDASIWNEHSKQWRTKIPSKQISEDLKVLKRTKEVLSRIAPLVEYAHKGDEIVSVIDEDISGNVIHKKIDEIIHDLETKQFSVISKHIYHPIDKPSKTDIEKHLLELADKYQISGRTNLIKQIKDNLRIPQIAELCNEADKIDSIS